MTNFHSDGVGARVLGGRLLLLRAAALELAGLLDELVNTLAGASRGDTGWLRPLAVATAELEFSVRHRFHVGASDVAAVCAEASDLLTAAPTGDDDFADRYSLARATTPIVDALHKRAIAGCRNLALRLSWEWEPPSSRRGVPVNDDDRGEAAE